MKPCILVGTPAYNSMLHTDYFHTAINFSSLDMSFSFLTLGNESLITRARNKILSIFYHNKVFTHLLFLDADIGMRKEDIVKLIKYDKDIIGAPVRLKDNERIVYNYGKIIGKEGALVEVEKVGTAVMLLSRKLVEDVVEYAKEQGDVYYHSQFFSRGDQIVEDKTEMYDVFKVGVLEGEYQSEDYWFCWICRQLGYKIYVDMNIGVVHNGMLGLEG